MTYGRTVEGLKLGRRTADAGLSVVEGRCVACACFKRQYHHKGLSDCLEGMLYSSKVLILRSICITNRDGKDGIKHDVQMLHVRGRIVRRKAQSSKYTDLHSVLAGQFSPRVSKKAYPLRRHAL
jgi:hypothetical protein